MKVAFASCCSVDTRYQGRQPIWGIISQQQPNLLLLLGDNVYMGKEGHNPTLELYEEGLSAAFDPSSSNTIINGLKRKILEGKYIDQTNEQHFKSLLEKVPFLAIWDNHDFGLPGKKYNDTAPVKVPIYGAEVDSGHREMAHDLFNYYLKRHSLVPDPSTVYCTYDVIECGKKIRFYMLDVRSRQDDPDGDFPEDGFHPTLLGRHQENWLLEELRASDADIDVICSGIPYRGWKQYNRWKAAFEQAAARRQRIMFLGGQVHHNEFNIHRLNGSSKLMYEVLSSGVGQNFSPDGEDDDGDPPHKNNPKIPDNPWLADLPRNNYGIIDFANDIVYVTLYSQFADHKFYAIINRENWNLDSLWTMQRKNNFEIIES